MVEVAEAEVAEAADSVADSMVEVAAQMADRVAAEEQAAAAVVNEAGAQGTSTDSAPRHPPSPVCRSHGRHASCTRERL